jgi:Ser/Thr protein kinase RdoA (MazF antagonist)
MEIPVAVREAYALADVRFEVRTGGWINLTLEVTDEAGPRILQRLHPVFRGELHHDVVAITAHLDARGVRTPKVVPTVDGRLWVDADGCWRMLSYVPGRTLTHLDATQAASAARLLARFHRALSDLDHTFRFTRPGAHDTGAHLARLAAARRRFADHPRGAEAHPLVDAVLDAADDLEEVGPLPRRIVHGDPKTTNVRFEGDEAIALLDLDTLAHEGLDVELGDALRSWCKADESDPRGEAFDERIFRAAMEGYAAGAAGGLAEEERAAIVPGWQRIALELASRLALDLYEDRYWGWDEKVYPSRFDHLLDRVSAQLGLAKAVAARRTDLQRAIQAIF